jgi:hypothetical protein
VAGERVALGEGLGPKVTLNLPRLSDGIYLVVLTAQSAATGTVDRTVIKMAVVH